MLKYGLKRTSIAFVITAAVIGIPALAMIGTVGALAAIVLGALPLSVLWGGVGAYDYSTNDSVAGIWQQLADEQGWECRTDEVQRPRLSGAVGERRFRARIERYSGGRDRFRSYKTQIEAKLDSDAAQSLELMSMPAVLAGGDDFESRFAIPEDGTDNAGIESAAARQQLAELAGEYDHVRVTEGRLEVAVDERIDDARTLFGAIEQVVKTSEAVDEAMAGQAPSSASGAEPIRSTPGASP